MTMRFVLPIPHYNVMMNISDFSMISYDAGFCDKEGGGWGLNDDGSGLIVWLACGIMMVSQVAQRHSKVLIRLHIAQVI